MSTQTIDKTFEVALRTVAINGSYNASRALSKWLRRGVRLTSEGFQSIPIAQAYTMIGEPDDVIAAIHLPLKGDLTGHLLLTFPEKVAMILADVIMQVPEGTTQELGEIEQSCLQETANIVGSAYANSLAKWLNLHIEPGVPIFVRDMASAIIDPFIMEFAAYHDEILMANTDFLMGDQRLEWGLLLLPSDDSLTLMQDRCRTDKVRQNALQTIAINGAFNASRAMSKWLKRGVKISTEGFGRVPIREIASSFDTSKPIIALHSSLGEQLHGHTVLCMSEETAVILVDLLMGQAVGTTKGIGEDEISCLQETGNIISSSFVNSWSNWLDILIEPTSPHFVYDLPEAVMASMIPEQALVSDEVFLAKSFFMLDDHWLEWVFFLLPDPSAMRLIESSCR